MTTKTLKQARQELAELASQRAVHEGETNEYLVALLFAKNELIGIEDRAVELIKAGKPRAAVLNRAGYFNVAEVDCEQPQHSFLACLAVASQDMLDGYKSKFTQEPATKADDDTRAPRLCEISTATSIVMANDREFVVRLLDDSLGKWKAAYTDESCFHWVEFIYNGSSYDALMKAAFTHYLEHKNEAASPKPKSSDAGASSADDDKYKSIYIMKSDYPAEQMCVCGLCNKTEIQEKEERRNDERNAQLVNAVSILKMAAAGELPVTYLSDDDEPFSAKSGPFQRFKIGSRYELVAFNDCGCFDYIDSITDSNVSLVYEYNGLCPIAYLTDSEQDSLDALMNARGNLAGYYPKRLIPHPDN